MERDMMMYISGKWVKSSSGKTLEKLNPSTGRTIRRFQAGSRVRMSAGS